MLSKPSLSATIRISQRLEPLPSQDRNMCSVSCNSYNRGAFYGDFLHRLSFRSTNNVRSRSRSSHIPGALFKYLYHGRGGNDIRELRKFSTQLDMLIEKPRFKGKVHMGADGGTMHGG